MAIALLLRLSFLCVASADLIVPHSGKQYLEGGRLEDLIGLLLIMNLDAEADLFMHDKAVEAVQHDEYEEYFDCLEDSVKLTSAPQLPADVQQGNCFDQYVGMTARKHCHSYRVPPHPYNRTLGAFDQQLSKHNPGSQLNFVRIPAEPVLVRSAQSIMCAKNNSLFKSVVRKVGQISWPKSEALTRNRALWTWQLITEEHLPSSELGIQLHNAGLQGQSVAELALIVQHSFAQKATSTLLKRGHALLKFIVWHKQLYGYTALPIEESKCYEYMLHLQRNGSAPTALAGFRSSIGFAAFVMFIHGAETAYKSLRIAGLAHCHYVTKAPKQPKRVLSVIEARVLEWIVFNGMEDHDKIAAGFFALQLHTRGRFKDVQFTKSFIVDFLENDTGGFLELRLLGSKTSTTKEALTTYMPLVAPAVGLLGRNWIRQWLFERERQGLSNTDFTCLLPAPNADGSWSTHPLGCKASLWLKELLVRYLVVVNLLWQVANHSLKSTALSWCAKYGLSTEVRKQLGHHSLGADMTMMAYSRDNQVLPLREYERVLAAIRAGEFLPDVTRSGRLVPSSCGAPLHVSGSAVGQAGPRRAEVSSPPNLQHEYMDEEFCIVPPVSDTLYPVAEDSEDGFEPVDETNLIRNIFPEHPVSDDDSSDSDSSIDDTQIAAVLNKKLPELQPMPKGHTVYIHERSSLLHLLGTDSSEGFAVESLCQEATIV